MEHAIVLKPEALFFWGNLPITNTLIVSWVVMLFLLVMACISTRNIQLIPSGLQNVVEFIIEAIYNTVSELAHQKTKVIFPIVTTFFLFIITANWFGLFPGFGTLTYQGVPLLRSINSDLNMTLSLALLSAVITHGLALYYLGLGSYLTKWFSLNPIFLFVGLLELVSEVTKVVSLSFRLFGNIFAGEVVLSTVSSIFAFLVPLPFYGLELVVGFVQAAVFMMLSLVFMVLLSEKHASH